MKDSVKSPLPESNQRPTDYKSVALPAELRRLFLVLGIELIVVSHGSAALSGLKTQYSRLS